MSRLTATGDDDHNVYYGTPLVHEEEIGGRKGKLIVEQGRARRVEPWNQEVTDAEGRRRFHGAFTGGFSAGYYNTVGSKEGWTPSSFSSSRNQRAGKKEQQVYDFLDEDEKEELKAKELASLTEYAALGSTADELARRAANKEYERRPSAIPGGVPDEIVAPLAPSIGVKLLMKMGWRPGSDLGLDHIALPSGFNKGAGLGVDNLEELDHGDEVDRDIGVEEEMENDSSTVRKRSKQEVVSNREDCLPGFHTATDSSLTVEPVRFSAPVIPVDFTSRHVMAAPVDVEQYLSRPEPPEVPSPDSQMTKDITGVAVFVARSGQRFEDILKQKHSVNPQFSFLFEGSPGHEFYLRKLWEEKRNLSKQGKKPIHSQPERYSAELVGAHRGKILGERPLPTAEMPTASSSNPKEERSSLVPSQAFSELTAQMSSRFTAGASDTTQKPDQGKKWDSVLQLSSINSDLHANPGREERPWRPTAILCKRFNLLDPFLGKVPIPPKPRIGTTELSINTPISLRTGPEPSRLTAPASTADDLDDEPVRAVITSESSIDLYKAIFSDDDDEDEDEKGKPSPALFNGSSGNQNLDTRDSDAMRNYMAAGDFLESLGKELGLRV